MPLPDPLAPDVTVSQAALLDAVQAHPVGKVTPTLPVVDAEVTVRLVGESVAVHAAPACVSVNAWFAIVIVAVRDDEPGFADTL